MINAMWVWNNIPVIMHRILSETQTISVPASSTLSKMQRVSVSPTYNEVLERNWSRSARFSAV
jgi:hypothetical protein